MAVNGHTFGLGAEKIVEAYFASGVYRAAVLEDTWTPNIDTDEFWDDVSAHEASGTGYTAEGIDVTSQISITYDAGTNKVIFDLTGTVEWDPATLTGQYLVIYQDTGTPSTSALLFYQDAGENIVSTGGPWTFTPAAGGIAQFGVS